MKILLIEDDVKIAAALRRGLQGEGYLVDVAVDGDTGFWMGSQGGFDLIILDILLPGRNGFQVCGDLRRTGIWTPILMLTAKDGELDEAEALDTGADDYLTKPFSFIVLLAHIRSMLRRTNRHHHETATTQLGDLRIDPRQRRTWRGEHEIQLTARQFDLLEFLLRRAGEVVSKQEILDGVWPFDFDGDINIVEVYIRRLRVAVDDPFQRHTIETVRGAGYRLTSDTTSSARGQTEQ